MSNTPSPHVFIVQDDGSRDFSDAARYGRLVPLVGKDVYPDEAEMRVQVVCEIIEAKMKGYRPGIDFILLTGDPVALMAVGLYLGCVHGVKKHRTLKYDREARGYYEVQI